MSCWNRKFLPGSKRYCEHWSLLEPESLWAAVRGLPPCFAARYAVQPPKAGRAPCRSYGEFVLMNQCQRWKETQSWVVTAQLGRAGTWLAVLLLPPLCSRDSTKIWQKLFLSCTNGKALLTKGCVAEGLFSLLSLKNKVSASRTGGIVQGSHSPGQTKILSMHHRVQWKDPMLERACANWDTFIAVRLHDAGYWVWASLSAGWWKIHLQKRITSVCLTRIQQIIWSISCSQMNLLQWKWKWKSPSLFKQKELHKCGMCCVCTVVAL